MKRITVYWEMHWTNHDLQYNFTLYCNHNIDVHRHYVFIVVVIMYTHQMNSMAINIKG